MRQNDKKRPISGWGEGGIKRGKIEGTSCQNMAALRILGFYNYIRIVLCKKGLEKRTNNIKLSQKWQNWPILGHFADDSKGKCEKSWTFGLKFEKLS